MIKAQRRKMSIIIVIVALFLLINVGYAFLAADLSFSGYTTVNSATFSVYFEDNYDSGSEDATCDSSIDDDTFSFSSTLTAPEEFCEYTVKARNAGSIGARVAFKYDASSDDSYITSWPYEYEDQDSGYKISIHKDDDSDPSFIENTSYEYLPTDSYWNFRIVVERTDKNCDESSGTCGGSGGAQSFSINMLARQATATSTVSK